MTHRQFRAWTEWLRIDSYQPSRDNWYQMSTQAEIRGVLGKPPASLKELVLREDKSGQPQRQMTPDERRYELLKADAIAKAKWMPALGYEAVKTDTKNGTTHK